MTRQFGQVLGRAAETLFQVAGQKPEVAPLIGPTAALIGMIAADIDNHISGRLRQGEQIKSLLRDARPLLPPADQVGIDAALALRLVEPEDFSLPNVEAWVVGLKRALIELHSWLETSEGRRHPALLAGVWSFAKADVDHVSRLVTPLW